MAKNLLLAIDQGTTSSRAMLFDRDGRVLRVAQQEFPQLYPREGWVEHDPEDLWRTVAATCKEAASGREGEIAALGITNQRETTLLWDRATGTPLGPAIVWQDRRTAAFCDALRQDGHEAAVRERTGLLLDPYFSATKLAWMLENIPGARTKAEKGRLAFGTVDCFLLWRLTEGRVHATDATNAARTMLYNIHTQQWDEALLDLFHIPPSLLPEVHDCAHEYGSTRLLGREIPILGIAGDQQAATVGQACFHEGMMKSTYGTGCFALINTGASALLSQHRLLTTVAYRLKGKPVYALEGSIFIAGAAVQWLRDKLHLMAHAAETEGLAAGLPDAGDVTMVPAFTGLGAPYWNPHARGAVFGLTRDSGPAHFAHAALESVCFQTHDLLDAMRRDGVAARELRVDGGMVANPWLMQRLADLTGTAITRPAVTETTAWGAAALAGLQAGVFGGLGDIEACWRKETSFTPSMERGEREKRLERWKRAVAAVELFAG